MLTDFIPQATVSVSATGTAATVAVKSAGSPAKVRIVVPVAAPMMFLKFGSASDAATSSDTPFLPGSIETVLMTKDQTNVSAISSTGSSGTVYITVGVEP